MYKIFQTNLNSHPTFLFVDQAGISYSHHFETIRQNFRIQNQWLNPKHQKTGKTYTGLGPWRHRVKLKYKLWSAGRGYFTGNRYEGHILKITNSYCVISNRVLAAGSRSVRTDLR
jgi:hypothetical protein